MMKLIDRFDVLSSMSTIDRYSQSHLSKNESVLEHTGFVCTLAYMIAVELQNHCELDIGSLLSKACVHDMDEIITGDLPRPTKYSSDILRNAIEELEMKNMSIISNKLGIDNLYSDWYSAKNETKEGLIIRICDTLAVLYKIHQEFHVFGNKSILNHVEGIENNLARQRSIALEMNFDIITDLLDQACIIQKGLQQKLENMINENEIYD